MEGKPCIRVIRITVGTIAGLLASGPSEAELLTAYPFLEEDDTRQASQYAAMANLKQYKNSLRNNLDGDIPPGADLNLAESQATNQEYSEAKYPEGSQQK